MLIFLIGVIVGVGIGIGFAKIVETKLIFKEVENKNRKLKSDATYWQLSTEGEDFLFTKEQLTIAKNRAESNPEDIQD